MFQEKLPKRQGILEHAGPTVLSQMMLQRRKEVFMNQKIAASKYG
jgi:hypothetical protein